jgi:site-specific recombinase XerD
MQRWPSERRPLSIAHERLRASLKAARLDETFGFHSLRHSYGTALAAQGVPMRTLQEWMGHRDIQTTQRYADSARTPMSAALSRPRSPVVPILVPICAHR